MFCKEKLIYQNNDKFIEKVISIENDIPINNIIFEVNYSEIIKIPWNKIEFYMYLDNAFANNKIKLDIYDTVENCMDDSNPLFSSNFVNICKNINDNQNEEVISNQITKLIFTFIPRINFESEYKFGNKNKDKIIFSIISEHPLNNTRYNAINETIKGYFIDKENGTQLYHAFSQFQMKFFNCVHPIEYGIYTKYIKKGWNLISYNNDDDLPLSDVDFSYLNVMGLQAIYITKFDPDNGYKIYFINKGLMSQFNTFTTLKKGYGYWIYCNNY